MIYLILELSKKVVQLEKTAGSDSGQSGADKQATQKQLQEALQEKQEVLLTYEAAKQEVDTLKDKVKVSKLLRDTKWLGHLPCLIHSLSPHTSSNGSSKSTSHVTNNIHVEFSVG